MTLVRTLLRLLRQGIMARTEAIGGRGFRR
jgi:hypothetical protein